MKTLNLLTAFLVVTLIFLSCNPQKSFVYEKPTENYLKNVDGKELFSGLILMNGRSSNMIPELVKAKKALGMDQYTDDQQSVMNTVNQNIILTISREHPGFFEEFKKQITSGDHRLVQDAVLRSSKVAVEAVTIQSELIKKVLNNEQFTEGLTTDNLIQELRENGISDYYEIEKLLKAYQDGRLDIEKIVNTNINNSINYDLNLQLDRMTRITQQLNIDINRVTAVNRYVDIDYNPVGSVAVDVETVVYAVVAVAVAAVVVAVVFVGDEPYFRDLGGLFQEKLVNSIAQDFNMNRFL